ncbi:MAG: biotin--[acetyl-CoA-carboxylase] ligase [Akkermansia sp.]|nr:biotin--[acetyl-CoA-carboxylase] ligase [Akkermansia sp.]
MSSKWKVKEVEECESTFNVARALPAWTVVSTQHQSRGRGRFNRTWFGNKGGLWATYNLPIDPSLNRHWGVLPLVAGAAVIETLKSFNIKGLRLRWPNDVLVGRAKLAGILVERPSATMASIGIGLNMFNDINELDGRTSDPVTRLCDIVPACPSIKQFRAQLGDTIARLFEQFVKDGIDSILPILGTAWGETRPVVAITDKERIVGRFIGVDFDGSPILEKADGTRFVVPGITVNQLKELI